MSALAGTAEAPRLLAPYGDDDAPADFPTPDKSVLRDGTARWHCDLWHQIVSAAIAGHPDQVRLDYHPALSQPAISRYAATSPDMLRWFKTYNAQRCYRDQVKPFSFLLSMSAAWDVSGERIVAPVAKGRRKKLAAIKPVTPFDTDHKKALRFAFDRETGLSVAASALRTYADALAQYHISPESKFSNADFLDWGPTIRRHVRMANIQHIGKEAHDWERQAILGLNDDSEIAYGVATAGLAEKLQAMITQFGASQSAKSLAISRATLAALVAGSENPVYARLGTVVAIRLTPALSHCIKLDGELRELRTKIERYGLREAARLSGVDPSNLRRRLRLHPGGQTIRKEEAIR